MKNVILRAWFRVPIYNVDVLLLVANDAVRAWRRYPYFVDDAQDGFLALCATNDKGDFGLFFHGHSITAGEIAHELDHLRDYIMEFIGDDFNPGKTPSEARAYLADYLHTQVYTLLRKHHVIVHRK